MNDYILVTAEKFGYGPIITCLNVVKKLKPMAEKNGLKLVFLGTSIAKEQAEKSGLFNEILECETFDYSKLKEFKTLFENAKAILCSENQFGAIYAKSLGLKNVFFLDNLVWMWDKITDGLENVDGYFISEIFDSHENFSKIGGKVKNAIFVGPLRDINSRKYKSKNELIINFGGAEAFMLDKSIVDKFYNKIVRELLIDEVVEKFDKIYVCGGSGVISSLHGDYSAKVIFKSMSNDEYLKKLHSCSHVIMSSGLGNYIESVGINKNIMYIPPINYSQLLQLKKYEKLNLGFVLINWDKYSFYKQVPELLDEETGVNMVVENAKKYISTDETIVSEEVLKFIKQPQDKCFEKRQSYIRNFPKNAAEVVASCIIKSIKG